MFIVRRSNSDNTLNKDQQEKDPWNFLAPYPTPNAKQDKIVHRVEVFANVLKEIAHILGLIMTPLTLLISFFKNIITKKKWKKRARAVPKNERIPPQLKAVHVANSQQTLDQKFYYCLKQGRIWYKSIAAPLKSAWQLFGPDGRPPSNAKLTAISSDGVNMVAIDETNTVYYVHTSEIDAVVTDDNWVVRKISLDWTDRWFAVPIINRIMSLKRSPQLKLPQGYRCFAISQKGPDTGYYTDMSGKKHPEFLVGVTTLYALNHDGRIFFADPWLCNEFRNEITAPEDGQFVAENMAVAASTLFVLRRDRNGNAVMYTRFADFDSMGSNPILPASYDVDNETALVRYLPAEDWMKQPNISLKKHACVTGHIAVLQLGRGQNNRQLRVEGLNEQGASGYYYKGIYEKNWHFELTPEKNLLYKLPITLSAPPMPSVNLKCDEMIIEKKVPIKEIKIKNFLRHGFNERGLHTVLQLTLNGGRQLMLPLYARRGVIHLFDKRSNQPHWNLVLPKEYRQDDNREVQVTLNEIFRNKKNISVIVNELQDGNIEIANKKHHFKFHCVVTKDNKTLTSSEDKQLEENSITMDSVSALSSFSP